MTLPVSQNLYESTKSSTSSGVRTKRSYVRVSKTKRKRLIKLVEDEQLSIKEASRRLKVNYSTAKAILKEFHNKGKVSEGSDEIVEKQEYIEKGEVLLELDKNLNASSKPFKNANVIEAHINNVVEVPITFDFSFYSFLIQARYENDYTFYPYSKEYKNC